MNPSRIRREIDRLRAEALAIRGPETAAGDIAEDLGLPRGDELADVLAATVAEVLIGRMLREAGVDDGPPSRPHPVLEALGVGQDASYEDIITAARSADREAVLAAYARHIEEDRPWRTGKPN